jgi:O-antigen/teichoic acid export membrane protein
LPQVVVVLLLVRLAAALFSLTFCFGVYPSLRHRLSFAPQSLRLLARCGSWVTVTNLVQPAFLYLDRFLIGALLSITAVAYYSAPLQLASSLAIFPASLLATLFPTFSAASARNDLEALEKICRGAFKALLLIEGPLVLLAVRWAPQILRLSLGEDFAAQSTFSFQTLAIGMLLFSLAYVPFNLLQAAGRPDLPAKFCLLELPIYAAGLWFLVGRMGIDGAALAWTLRAGLDAMLLARACSVLKLVPLDAVARNGCWRSLAMFVVLAMIISPVPLVAGSILRQGIVAGLGMCLFAVVVWRYGLDSNDKGFLGAVFRRLATNATRWS